MERLKISLIPNRDGEIEPQLKNLGGLLSEKPLFKVVANCLAKHLYFASHQKKKIWSLWDVA